MDLSVHGLLFFDITVIRHAAEASVQFAVHSVGNRFQPLVGAVLAGHLQGQVREPAVGRGAVPVLHLRRDIDHVSRAQRPGLLAPLLIPAPAGHAQKDLTAALAGVVDVPVVAAINWTPPPQSLVVAGFNGIHICALCESFLTSSFCQVIFLFLPRSKPLLQG